MAGNGKFKMTDSIFSEVFLRYGAQRRIVFSSGTEAPCALKKLAKKYFDENNILCDIGFKWFDTFLKNAGCLNHELRCYDDALAFIAEMRDADYRRRHLKKIFPDGIESKAFAKLLKIPMYPYQRNGTLFAGVLDAGKDNIFLGKSRLKKFMESVETVTGAIPETDHETPTAEPEIPVEAKTAPEPGPEPVTEPWQELLNTGAAFLQALGRNTAGGQKSGRPDLTTLLERDEKTGKSYLKIPLPDKEVIQSTLPAINSLLGALKDLMR